MTFALVGILAVAVQEEPVRFETSPVLEALLFLDALPEEWAANLDKEADAARAVRVFSGQGIGLAHLFSDCRDFDALECVDPVLPEESAYGSLHEVVRRESASLRAYVKFLRAHDFEAWWKRTQGATLQKARDTARAALGSADLDRLLEELAPFLPGDRRPKRPVTVFLTVFSGKRGYALRGDRVGISAAVAGDIRFLLPHELAHRFEPAERLRQRLHDLSKADREYGRAFARIYATHREGIEEEFVYAAGLVAAQRAGWISEKRAIRKLKYAYADAANPRDAGVPAAAIIFERLREARVDDYAAFLEGLFEKDALLAGSIQKGFRAAIEPISGIAGLELEEADGGLRVKRVFAGFAAAKAGLEAGDRISSIDGTSLTGATLEDALDLIAGRRGEARSIGVRRGERSVTCPLTLE